MHIVRYHLVKSSKTQRRPNSLKTHIVFDENVEMVTTLKKGWTGFLTRKKNQMLCSRSKYLQRPDLIEGPFPSCPNCLEYMESANLLKSEDK